MSASVRRYVRVGRQLTLKGNVLTEPVYSPIRASGSQGILEFFP
jgi:hypothetical protein